MNRAARIILHTAGALAVLLLAAGIPLAVSFHVFEASDASDDAVSSASIVVDAPSGNFVVLINRSAHEDSIGDWVAFCAADADSDEDLPILWDDVRCIYADGDESGKQLAERYQSMLSPDQMTVRSENATLLVSKAEAGLIDMAIFSKEYADALQLGTIPDSCGIEVIEVGEGES